MVAIKLKKAVRSCVRLVFVIDIDVVRAARTRPIVVPLTWDFDVRKVIARADKL
jgi:hypothetical protein